MERLKHFHTAISLLFFVVGLLIGQNSFGAYFLASISKSELDPRARTHILVVGKGNALGATLQYAAYSKVQAIRKVFPQDQVLLITVQEKEFKHGANLLYNLGFNYVRIGQQKFLDLQTLMNEMRVYSQIASLNVFSHSAAPADVGIFLDDSPEGIGFRWNPHSPEIIQLRGHFTKDAFAVLHGCNSGHLQAPLLSTAWNIPVAGALAGTHFEVLYQDGFFYWGDTKLQDQMATCASKSCIRLKPDNMVYEGYWGSHSQGLPFVKFFCPQVSTDHCLTGMALSIVTSVSQFNHGLNMTFDQYKKAVQDWMCPSGLFGSAMQKNCIATLAGMDMKNPKWEYTPLLKGSSQCSFHGCYQDAACYLPGAKSCAAQPPTNKTSSTFMMEYLFYLEAYKHLKAYN